MQLNNPEESSSPILYPDPAKEEIRWPKKKKGKKKEKNKKR